MTEGQALYLIVVLIYLSECVVWLPGDAFAFVMGIGRRWRVAHPGTGWGNETGRFVLVNVLPFGGGIFTATQWPLALGGKGFTALKLASPGRNRRSPRFFSFLPWEGGPFSSSGRGVLASGRLILTCGSAQEADWLSGALDRLSQASENARPGASKKILGESLRREPLLERMAVYERFAPWLRILAVAQFILLFVCAPVAWRFAGDLLFLLTLAVLLAHGLAAAVVFRRAHKQMHPQRRGERLKQTIMIALAPTHAIRALDHLSRGLGAGTHALTAARVLASPEAFAKMAGVIVRDLHFPLPASATAAVDFAGRSPGAESAGAGENASLQKSAAAEFHSLETEMLERYLAAEGFPAENFLLSPAPDSQSAAAWCPRCQTAYVAGVEKCADCMGVALAPFEKDGGAAAAAALPE